MDKNSGFSVSFKFKARCYICKIAGVLAYGFPFGDEAYMFCSEKCLREFGDQMKAVSTLAQTPENNEPTQEVPTCH